MSRTSIWTMPFSGRGAERDHAAVGRPAERVREQVRDHLQHPVAVGDDRRRVGILVEPEVDLAAARLLAEARVGRSTSTPMSTSCACTVNRCALSFARSSTSPTSRSSRIVSPATTSSDARSSSGSSNEPVADRVDVALDRRQRRAELVRDRHQELPLALLGRRQARCHLVELLGEVADLVAAAAGRARARRSSPPRSRRPHSTAPAPAR